MNVFKWLNFVWNLPCWNLGRGVLLLDHMAPISLCVLHLYEKCIVCPSVYVTYIVYWAHNVRRQQLIVKSADASINQTVCQVKNVLMFTLHTEYNTGAKHNTLCQAGISQCYRHDDVILRNVEFGTLSDSKTMLIVLPYSGNLSQDRYMAIHNHIAVQEHTKSDMTSLKKGVNHKK